MWSRGKNPTAPRGPWEPDKGGGGGDWKWAVVRNTDGFLLSPELCVAHSGRATKALGLGVDWGKTTAIPVPWSWEAPGSQGHWDGVIIRIILGSCFPCRNKESSHSSVGVSRSRAVTVHTPLETRRANTAPLLRRMCWRVDDGETWSLVQVRVWECWRLDGTVSCSYTMEKGACPAALQSQVLQQKKRKATGQGHQDRQKQSWKRFLRHLALNPCPSYALPACIALPSYNSLPPVSFPIKEQNECNVYCYKKRNAIIGLRRQLTECWHILLKET